MYCSCIQKIIFFCIAVFSFLFGIKKKHNKKKLFQFFVSVRYYNKKKKKNCFSFTGYSNLCLKLLQFFFVRYYKKKKIVIVFFFSSVLYLLQVIQIFVYVFGQPATTRLQFFKFLLYSNFFEDCSFSISIVLKYLFLYSNIFCFCTAVLHSKYLLHVYIQIFTTEMASPSTPVNVVF